MSDFLYLRKGLLANLADAPKMPGAISITTDERAMYLDLSESERIRIGDFIQVANKDELFSAKYQPYSTTAFYYVEDINGLYKYTGTTWKLVNEKTEIKDVDLSGIESNITANAIAIAANQTSIADLNTLISTLDDDLQAEIERAQLKENELATAVTNEESRARAAETALSTDINNVNISISTVASDLATEVARAKKAESNLSSAIADVEITQSSLNTKITTVETEYKAADQLLYTNTTNLRNDLTQLNTDLTNVAAAIRREFDTADTSLKTEIQTEYQEYVQQALSVADAMVFMGVLHAKEDIPTRDVARGHTYKIGTAFSYEGTQYYVGDLIIANEDQPDADESYLGGWSHVSSGYEDDYDAKLNGDSDTNTISLLNGIEASRGNITFVGTNDANNTNGGIDVSLTVGNSLGGDSVTVSVGMVWGSF